MRNRGLTRKKSILLHGMQHFCAFLAVICASMLVLYSFASVKVDNANYPGGRIIYDWNLFSQEKSFDETSTFDHMLMNTLQEIIRYNVAKSQLEVDGEFDGSKLIDVRAFANRKNDLQRGQDYVLVDESGGAPMYLLEDLLKWNRYGLYYDLSEMPLDVFLSYFEGDMKVVRGYGYYEMIVLSEAQTEILRAYLGDIVDELLSKSYEAYGYEAYGYEYQSSDAETNLSENADTFFETEIFDETKETTAEAEEAEVYVQYKVILPPAYYMVLADIMLNNPGCIDSLYLDYSTGQIMVQTHMLQERYLPSYGVDLQSCAYSWENYWQMVTWVQQAVEDLAYNYNEYLDFKERYSADTTNIVYTFEMTMMGEQVRVSNLSKFAEGNLDEKEVDAYYRSTYGRYMIYRPQTMTFESNTGIIEEADLFAAFSDYEYAYPETAKIWLAVDTTYPANDQFAQADAAYAFMHPYAFFVTGIGLAAIVTWFILLLFLSVMTGYRKNAEKEVQLTLSWFDAIPTEPALLLGGGAMAGILFFAYLTGKTLSGNGLDFLCRNRLQVTLFLGSAGMVASMLFCLFWYSLLRRIKAHILWKNSLLNMLMNHIVIKAVRRIKASFLKVYANSSLFVKCLLSFGSIMAVNFALGVVFFRYFRYGRSRDIILIILSGILINGAIIYLWFMHGVKRRQITEGVSRIRDGELAYQINTEGLHGENLQLAEAVNSIGEGIKTAVETSMKDERLKADLITNVSHDIKTPLTSIINYVDLLKREKIETEPVKGYISVLDAKSQRLKQLTDDLVEASKISSGNITLIMERINLTELIHQSMGEFSEKFEEKHLQMVESLPADPVCIRADSRRIWRVVENLFGNIYKYALPGTRVYMDMELSEDRERVSLSIKNISSQSLNIKAEELTERFIRGDVSRSTEGSGLGLSIAKNLTELQNGRFHIYLDGDLFKVTLTFPVYTEEKKEE